MDMMQVVAPQPVPDFNFDSTCSSPYITAPSSPQRFGTGFFLAPTPSSFVAPNFEWDEKQGFHGNDDDGRDGCEDFEFEFSGQLDRTSLSAEELFDGGKIRPLKPPPAGFSHLSTPSSPKSPRINKDNNIDPFELAAIDKYSRSRRSVSEEKNIQQQRGRERTNSSYVHKKSRSLSPFRVVSDTTMFEEEDDDASNNPKSNYVSSILSAISFSSKGNKKWKLKDLLLFRSASEGRATTTTSHHDSFKKYAVLSKKEADDPGNLSFRSSESVGSTSSRRRGPVSAHEMHYTANRAVSEEMRRKTCLPYKHGLLGCLGFNPRMNEVSKGIASFTRG